MMAKKEVEQIKYAKLEEVRFCPSCGKRSIMQHPVNEIKNIISCGACGVNFKIIIEN